jgi:hypothetical protein
MGMTVVPDSISGYDADDRPSMRQTLSVRDPRRQGIGARGQHLGTVVGHCTPRQLGSARMVR